MLSVIFAITFAECYTYVHYAECHYAECSGALQTANGSSTVAEQFAHHAKV
jgi:hypothetical protein